MPFNVMILAWLIYYAVGPLRQEVLDAWLTPWSEWVTTTVFPKFGEALALLALLIVPLLFVGAVLYMVDSLFFGLVAFILQVILLVYSTGRTPVDTLIEKYTDSYCKEDTQAAFHVVSAYLDDTVIESRDDLHIAVRRMLAYERYSAFFAVIMWFLILGPLAALFYRLCQMLSTRCRRQGEACFILHRRIQSLFYFLDWLPVRVLALFFAIGGNASAVLRQYSRQLFSRETPGVFLDHLSMVSLYGVERNGLEKKSEESVVAAIREIKFSDQLIRRSVVVGIVVIAILLVGF